MADEQTGRICHGSTADRGVGIIVVRYGQILVSQRKNKDGSLGPWQCPGGHVEKHDDCLSAAARELLEETGLNFEPSRFTGIIHNETSVGFKGQTYQACAFIAQARDDEYPSNPELDKNTPWQWMEPTEFARMEFVLPRTLASLTLAFQKHTELFIPNGPR